MDHVRLGQCRRAVAHRRRQYRPLPVQRRREGEVGTRVGEPRTGVLGQPPAGVLRTRRVGEVTRIGEDPQPQLRQLGLRRTSSRSAVAFSSTP